MLRLVRRCAAVASLLPALGFITAAASEVADAHLTASPRFVSTQGSLTVELTTPNNDDGAILFTITGPSILSIAPHAGLDLLESRATANGSTTSTILLRGDVATGALGQLSVRGVDLDASYTAQVREVAARASAGYAQRSDLASYRVTIRR